jgi:hypothetical protein
MGFWDPQGLGRLSVGGKKRQKGVIREQRIQLIGEAQVPVPLGKAGTGDTSCFRGDGFNGHRAKHGAPPTDLPPTICADPSEKLRDSSIFRAMM